MTQRAAAVRDTVRIGASADAADGTQARLGCVDLALLDRYLEVSNSHASLSGPPTPTEGALGAEEYCRR
ncbi:MAG TPA: hypothetical protein VI197_04815 [Polyangiaceae bacterium]